MKTPKVVELKPADVQALLMRVEKGALQEGDYEIIKSLVETLAYLSQAVDEKATAIKRLLRVIFGAKTETREKLFKIGSNPKEVDTPEEESEPNRRSNRVTAETVRMLTKKPSGSKCPSRI